MLFPPLQLLTIVNEKPTINSSFVMRCMMLKSLLFPATSASLTSRIVGSLLLRCTVLCSSRDLLRFSSLRSSICFYVFAVGQIDVLLGRGRHCKLSQSKEYFCQLITAAQYSSTNHPSCLLSGQKIILSLPNDRRIRKVGRIELGMSKLAIGKQWQTNIMMIIVEVIYYRQ